jgi:RimJ/RimL family protein N-acetyltransferase
MTIIKAKGFILRPLKTSDLKGYFEVMQDEETRRNLSSFPGTLAEAKKEIKEMLKQVKEDDSEVFSIEVGGKYAGNIILQHQDWDKNSDEGRVHTWIHPKFRRKGLATDALTEVVRYGLRKKFKMIYAQCKAHNKGVIKMLPKLGFEKVKTHKVDGIPRILWVKER